MLLFSTKLKIRETMTREALIKLVIRWNQESKYERNIIPGLNWDGSFHCRYVSDNLWLAIEEYKPEKIVAVRFEKQEADGSIWDTDYVMNFREGIMCIRLDRSYRADAVGIRPKFSTPHFITLLEQKGYLAEDGALAVSREPVLLSEANMDLLADVIFQKQSFRLPVVFVSKRFCNEDPVDTAFLASRVKGAAHVLVQEDAASGYALRQRCESLNEFDGAVGIYFPNAAKDHVRCLCHAGEGVDEVLMEKIVRTVIQYSNAQMVEPLYTWQGVNNAILRERVEAGLSEKAAADTARRNAEQELLEVRSSLNEQEQRMRQKAAEDARKEADKILDSFDNELRYLQKQIEELTRANEVLQYENQGLKAKLDTVSEQPVLYLGEEKEFYPSEIRDLILLVLSEAVSGSQETTRRSDVVKDILRHNDYQRISEHKAGEIKKLLKTYEGMTAPVRQTLEAMGFVITEDGKHYKLTYYGDERYQVIISKTPSDVRTGKNSAAKINRMVF